MRIGLPLLVAGLAGACSADGEGGATVIVLERGGATVAPGEDDAARGTSSLVGRAAHLPAAALDDAAWGQVMSCVRGAFAAFDVVIVDSPPAHDDFVMAVFGGDGGELGRGADQHGLAPLGCDPADGGIAFVFTDNLANDPARACDVAVHELAHVFGVDHQLLATEPTSYLAFSGRRAFGDAEAPCGESTARECACGGRNQNSFRTLLDRLGPARDVDAEPPSVALAATPSARGGLAIHVTAHDATGLGPVVLHYADDGRSITSTCGDGALACTARGDEFSFAIPAPVGRAVFSAEVTDVAGNRAITAEHAHVAR